jgi:hypothetical protein
VEPTVLRPRRNAMPRFHDTDRCGDSAGRAPRTSADARRVIDTDAAGDLAHAEDEPHEQVRPLLEQRTRRHKERQVQSTRPVGRAAEARDRHCLWGTAHGNSAPRRSDRRPARLIRTVYAQLAAASPFAPASSARCGCCLTSRVTSRPSSSGAADYPIGLLRGGRHRSIPPPNTVSTASIRRDRRRAQRPSCSHRPIVGHTWV